MMILVIKPNNDFVNSVFDKVRYTLDTKTQTGMRRTDDGKLVLGTFQNGHLRCLIRVKNFIKTLKNLMTIGLDQSLQRDTLNHK